MMGSVALTVWMNASGRISQVFSAPTPAPKSPDPDTVTPGVWGFLIIFLIAVVTILLIFDMVRRVRRTRYRAEIGAKLNAEESAAARGDSGEDSEDTNESR